MLIVVTPSENNVSANRSYQVTCANWDEKRRAARQLTPVASAMPNGNVADRRFLGALLSCGIVEDEAHRLTFLHRRLPMLLASGQDIDENQIPEGVDLTMIDQMRAALLYGSV